MRTRSPFDAWLDGDYAPYGSSKVGQRMMGRTGNEKDRSIFRVLLLLNIAKAPPYIHDGSVAAPKKATDIMARGQLGKVLGDSALNELVASKEAQAGPAPKNFRLPKGIPFELLEDTKL